MHYFQHNIADYRKDTSHLSLLEHGCYRQLLDQYYLNEQPLPLDESKLFRLLSARTNDEKQAIKNVLQDFFYETENGFIHKRCDLEIQIYHDRIENASKAGRASANRRLTNVQQEFNDCSTTVQLTNNHKPITNNHIDILSDFDEFWSLYPKKIGKNAARKSWNKIKPNIEAVIQALTWQKQSKQWFEKGGQFIPNPSTWINQHRWDDEPPEKVTF
jgi:uncharacterized protein YdaU (DUF1376 family)